MEKLAEMIDMERRTSSRSEATKLTVKADRIEADRLAAIKTSVRS